MASDCQQLLIYSMFWIGKRGNGGDFVATVFLSCNVFGGEMYRRIEIFMENPLDFLIFK
jgi:hypothetical protein